jgi:hypothetical protein
MANSDWSKDMPLGFGKDSDFIEPRLRNQGDANIKAVQTI